MRIEVYGTKIFSSDNPHSKDMNLTEIIAKQTEDAYGWVTKLIRSIPDERWDDTPDIVDSNVSWQVGHLIVSYYYHSVMVTVGHQPDILKEVPLREYSAWFAYGSHPRQAVGQVAVPELREQLAFMGEQSLAVIRALPPEELDHALEPTSVVHPVASNQWEALDWNVKHTMWHCGQLGILKRVVNERFDFGLRKVD